MISAEYTDLDLAYAAGFVEADGCIYLNSADISVRVTNRNDKVLEWFGLKFGGITRPKVIPVGCYEWCIYGENAVNFINMIYGYLLFKGPQCDIALEFSKLRGRRGLKLSSEKKSLRARLLQDLKDEKAKWRS